MTFFLCKLWPYLAGGLIGWLLAGWLARRFKYAEPSVETVVEKIVEKRVEVDNPQHLALIGKLEKDNSEMSSLRSKLATYDAQGTRLKKLEAENAQIAGLQSKLRSFETTGLKTVDNPQHLALISKLEKENSEIAGLRAKLGSYETQSARLQKLEADLETGLEAENAQIAGLQSKLRGFENTAAKSIDNPQHLALISKLEKENSEMSGLKAKLVTFDMQEAKLQKLEKENAQIARLNGRIDELENTEPKIIEKEVEKRVDNPEHLKTISTLEDEVATWKRGPKLDMVAARAAGIQIKDENDLTAIEGIGPKINDLLHADGIKSLKDLAEADTTRIQQILNKGGSQYQMANPGTWSDQADFACSNRWHALKALQDILDGGVYPDASANTSNVAKVKQLTSEVATLKNGLRVDISAAKAAGIVLGKDNDFTAIEGIGPKINVLIHTDGIHSFKELSEVEPSRLQEILDKAGSSFTMANPDTWPDQANLAASNRWPALKALQDILDGGVYPDVASASAASAKVKKLEAELESYRSKEKSSTSTVSVADFDKAKTAGFTLRRNGNQDDFTAIEGVGPKINDLIHAEGIHTFSVLAATDISIIQKILDKAGSSFKLADPETWSAQSDLAAKNEWEKLMKWQDELDGGKS